jgi:hypothetical protein
VTLRHRCLDNYPPRHHLKSHAVTTYPENLEHKSLFHNTLPLTHFDGILCQGGLLFSILWGEKQGGRGVARASVVSGYMALADGLDTSSASLKEQIPHRLKPVRDDKHKGQERDAEASLYPNRALARVFQRSVTPVRDEKCKALVTAQLKLRPFKASRIRLLLQAVMPPRDGKNPGHDRRLQLRFFEHRVQGFFQPGIPYPSDLAKSERRIAKSGRLRRGVGSYAG